MIDQCLAVQPGAHNMVVAVVGELGASEGDRGVDDGCVWHRDARDDTGQIGEYEYHFASNTSDKQAGIFLS